MFCERRGRGVDSPELKFEVVMKRVVLLLVLSVASQVSIASTGGDARNAKTGEIIMHYADPIFVTDWIYQFCQLDTVIIIPNSAHKDVGVVCKRR